MEKLNEIGVLFFPGFRGLMYLEAFVRNGVIPSVVIIQGKIAPDEYKKHPVSFWQKYVEYFDSKKTLEYYLSTFSMDFVHVGDSDINSEELRKTVLNRPERYFIFSGGGIIRENLLNTGKNFVHIHPGILPDFKGSTCYYYSILKENQCGSSAFFMERDLDKGEVIAKKIYEVPKIKEKDWFFFDLLFDPWVRAELCYKIIKSFKESRLFNSYPQDKTKGELYFIIHPVLKNLAIKRQITQQD